MRLLSGFLSLAQSIAFIVQFSSILSFVSAEAISSPTSDYDELLLLRPLPGNALLASFNFKTNGTIDSNHMTLFPRSLNQVLQASHTKELHLKFTLGRWNAEDHGAQPDNGQTAGGTGVELWAWVEASSDEEAMARWTTLTNALSGLFCASLNFIDTTRTIRPVLTFQPTGHHNNFSLSRLHLLHGSLPREPVCTENLTPFLKLLPCKGKVGISSLLDGHKLFDAQWQSMSIDVRPVCDGKDCKLQMEQVVDMVVDIERSLRRRDSPVPKPKPNEQLICDAGKEYAHDGISCFPLDNISDLGWSLSEIFGRPLQGSCPLATSPTSSIEPEHVCLDVPEQRSVFVSVGSKEVRKSEYRLCYIVNPKEPFDLVVKEQEPALHIPREEPLLYAERSFTGYGQERGGVQAVLRNPSLDKAVEFIYLESLPWFMKPYLHTLSAKMDSPFSSRSMPSNKEIIKEIYYRPALDRKRGTQLELVMSLPPQSTVLLTYDFEKAILRYTEYPPDANRGFDIGPAIIAISRGDALTKEYIRTTSLLLNLPTPDFSMPYNVIILTSTVMALAFGSMFNILVRRFVGREEVERLGEKVRRILREGVGKVKALGADKKKTE